MEQFSDTVEKKYLPIETAETLFVNPMTDMYNSLRNVLRDNNILTADAIEEQ